MAFREISTHTVHYVLLPPRAQGMSLLLSRPKQQHGLAARGLHAYRGWSWQLIKYMLLPAVSWLGLPSQQLTL